MINISDLRQVSEDEHKLIVHAEEEYGAEYCSVQEIALLYGRYIQNVSADHYIFLSFLAQFNKHLVLAVLSAVRRHQIQSLLDLRQVIESGLLAAYAVEITDLKKFVVNDAFGMLEVVESCKTKCYRWLATKYPSHDKAILSVKTKFINNIFAHANLITTQSNFRTDEGKYHTLFWDENEKIMVRQNLWLIGNTALCLLDILFQEAKSHPNVEVDTSFPVTYERLRKTNYEIRSELVKHPTFSRWLTAT